MDFSAFNRVEDDGVVARGSDLVRVSEAHPALLKRGLHGTSSGDDDSLAALGQISHSKGGPRAAARYFWLKSRDSHDTHCYVLIQVMGDDFDPVLTVATDSLAFAD